MTLRIGELNCYLHREKTKTKTIVVNLQPTGETHV